MAISVRYPKRATEYRSEIAGSYIQPHAYIALDMRDGGKVYAGHMCIVSGCLQPDPDVQQHHVIKFGFARAKSVRQVRAMMDGLIPFAEALVSSYSTYEDDEGQLCGKYDLDALDAAIWAMERLNRETK